MAVQRETEYVLRWDELDEATATNLYLYGTLETPEALYDRIYPAGYEGGAFGGPRVVVDAGLYMADGPGQFATPSLVPAIKEFFNPEGLHLEPGTYERADIEDLYGYEAFDEDGNKTNEGFKFVLTQYQLDQDSSDYDQRTYVYSTGGFAITDRADIRLSLDLITSDMLRMFNCDRLMTTSTLNPMIFL